MCSSEVLMAAAVSEAKRADPVQACPIAPVVDLVFSRWTTPIL
jgi:hypothetical protein